MKTQNPVIGASRGSAGNATATRSLGRNIFKAKPESVANPKTEAQTKQRYLLAFVQKIVSTLSDNAIEALYPVKVTGMSKRNKMVQDLMKAALRADEDGLSLKYNSGIIGNGHPTQAPTYNLKGSELVDMEIKATKENFGMQPSTTETLFFVDVNLTKGTARIVKTNKTAPQGGDATFSTLGFTTDNDYHFIYTCIYDKEQPLPNNSEFSFGLTKSNVYIEI